MDSLKVVSSKVNRTWLPSGSAQTDILPICLEDNDWDFSVDEDASFEDPQNPSSTPFKLYHASKLLSNNATWSFWQTAKPHYSLVSIHPTFVIGHNLVQSSADELGSNGVLWGPIMTGTPGAQSFGVHVEDVAEAHIKALDPSIPNGAKYLLDGERTTWKEVAQIVHRDYPNAGAKIRLEAEGGAPPVDTSKAEQELGMKWRSWDQMIHELMDQQLDFIKNKPAV
jgi:nucleoside-diphosphate-sugar epimerase